MAVYFNLNNYEISKELLVNTFNMMLDNQGRLRLNDQSITSPHNEPQRSEFLQKQLPEVFCRKRCSIKRRKFYRKTPVLESLFNKNLFADVIMLLLNIRRDLPWQLSRADVNQKGCISIQYIFKHVCK